MAEYLNIYDPTRKKVAILENAHNIVEDEKLNAVGTLSFDLPINDQKNEYCKPFYYARYGETGQLYRILTPTRKRTEVGTYSYVCEHVLATLIDDVLFESHVVGNTGMLTRDVINYVLSKQTVKRWQLGECDFAAAYEYGWENENLLSALFSIPNLFTAPYMWVYDTTLYPWYISLKFIDINRNPQFYVRAAKNLLVSDTQLDYAGICTRLYMLGYGEGVNQLKISGINNGLPYIQSSPDVINKSGGTPISRILVDRRFEDAYSLMEFGKAQLKVLENPVMQNTVQAADLYELTHADYDKAEVGRIIKLVEDDTKTYIVGVRRNHDNPGNMDLTLSNSPFSIASSIADLADRQRIESVYAQGATQIYAQSVQANATPDKGAEIHFYIPSDMRIINWVMAKIKIGKFRAYTNNTKGGGAVTKTSSTTSSETKTSTSTKDEAKTSTSTKDEAKTSTSTKDEAKTSTSTADDSKTSSDGGSTNATSSVVIPGVVTSTNAGGASLTSKSGGGVSSTTSRKKEYSVTLKSEDYTGANSNKEAVHTHPMSHQHIVTIESHAHSFSFNAHAHTVDVPGHTHDVTLPSHDHTVQIGSHNHNVTIPGHNHSVTIPGHSHSVTIPGHSHSVTIPGHNHSITIAGHNHTIELPDHTHAIEPGIFEYGNPGSAQIFINNNSAPAFSMAANGEFDLSAALLDSNGKIPRGQWLTVKVVPNDLAYVTIDLVIKGFCQSRGGSTY